MNALAQALAIAASYIAARPPLDDDEEDQDVAILETLAFVLHAGTPEEIEALDKAASQLAEREKHPLLKESLTNLMQHFGQQS